MAGPATLTPMGSDVVYKVDLWSLPMLDCQGGPNVGVRSAAAALQALVASKLEKQKLVAAKQTVWSSVDALELTKAVHALALALQNRASTREGLTLTNSNKHALAAVAVADSPWLMQLFSIARNIKKDWEKQTPEQKQADHAAYDLMCVLGLMLARLYMSVMLCAQTASKAKVEKALQQICSTTAQKVLHESISCYILLFRNKDPVVEMMAEPIFTGGYDAATQQNQQQQSSDSSSGGDLWDVLQELYGIPSQQHQTEGSQQPLRNNANSNSNDANSSHGSVSHKVLMSRERVPHQHQKWTAPFQLTTLPTSLHAYVAREVLVGWGNVCRRAEAMQLPVLATPGVVVLAVEAMWLLLQPDPDITKGQWAATEAAGADVRLIDMWDNFVTRLLRHLEKTFTSADAGAGPSTAAAAATLTAGQAAVQKKLELTVGMVAYLLLGMLEDALKVLREQWVDGNAAKAAAARAAFIRNAVLGVFSKLPQAQQQQKLQHFAAQHTGSGGAATAQEKYLDELYRLIVHLCRAVGNLLQLEKNVATAVFAVDVTDASKPWRSALWRALPRQLCNVQELLLRGPGPLLLEPAERLLIVLNGGMWDAIKLDEQLLLQDKTGSYVMAVIATNRKVARLLSDSFLHKLYRATMAARGQQPEEDNHQCPPWLETMVEVDLVGTLRAGFLMVGLLLDGAQKVLWWRWYHWWQKQQAGVSAVGSGSQPQAPAVTPPTASSSSSSRGQYWCDAAAVLALGIIGESWDCIRSLGITANTDKSGADGVQVAADSPEVTQTASLAMQSHVGNAMILTELNRLQLLPDFETGDAAAAATARRQLDVMLRSVLQQPLQQEGVDLGSLFGQSTAPRAPPAATASLAAHDAWMQQLRFDAPQSMLLCESLTGVNTPVQLAVGCHNPTCSNVLGLSERELKGRVCSACKVVRYCSTECQGQHWKQKQYGHKKECAMLKQRSQRDVL